MSEFINIDSIADVHRFLGFGPPLHPLISVVTHVPEMNAELTDMKINFGLYFISLKGDIKGSFLYGRKSYDFEEGTIIYVAPGQVVTVNEYPVLDFSGWTLFFHPDLIRQYNLGQSIKNYSYFKYDITEALQLSDKEKTCLSRFIEEIKNEISQHLDKHSQTLIVHNLEAILKYSDRFYERQFLTRTPHHSDLVIRFSEFLDDCFESNQLPSNGPPTVTQCGEALNMSGHYLSDLLKNETGKSIKEHIHLKLIDVAKLKLLNSSLSISEIAYGLGFDYPQNFSKLFKVKTGFSPSDYRTHLCKSAIL